MKLLQDHQQPGPGLDLVEEHNEVFSKESLDHKIPTSRGGFDTVSNLHWTTKQVNTVKSNLMHDEFINLCKVVLAWGGGGGG